MKIIGLTGGIGSGKSTISDYLTQRGFHVLDADKIAREIVMPGSEALIELISVFGEEILLSDGSLDRKKLGAIIFSDAEKKKMLDDIMHTRILEIIHQKVVEFRETIAQVGRGNVGTARLARDRTIFIDAALLFETGLDKFVSEIWVVDVEKEIRIKRVIDRDGLSRGEILKRIENQMNQEQKNSRADEILDNSGSKEALYQQIDDLINRL